MKSNQIWKNGVQNGQNGLSIKSVAQCYHVVLKEAYMYYFIIGLKIILAIMFVQQGYKKVFDPKEQKFWGIGKTKLKLLGTVELTGAILLYIIPNPVYVSSAALVMVMIATLHFTKQKKKTKVYTMPAIASSILITTIILSLYYYY